MAPVAAAPNFRMWPVVIVVYRLCASDLQIRLLLLFSLSLATLFLNWVWTGYSEETPMAGVGTP